MVKIKTAIGFLSLVILTSCAPATQPMSVPEPPQMPAPFTPSQLAECKKQGGTMQAGGMLGTFSCVIRYADAGKQCRDKSDCQGKCLSYELGKEIEAGKAVGQCQADNSPFGCYAEVNGGTVGPGLCVD